VTGRNRLILVAGADRLGRTVETVLLVLSLSAMVLLAATQIALRNFGEGGFDWADEALRILVLWVAMLGAVAASREQRHVSIDALSRYLPQGLRSYAAFCIEAFTAVICITLAWHSWLFVADSRAAGDLVLGRQVPAWMVQAILPVGFALMGYRYTFSCARRILRLLAGGRRT
jgi:TRAP-type C4-dicarboxylate transport system permease small subunit